MIRIDNSHMEYICIQKKPLCWGFLLWKLIWINLQLLQRISFLLLLYGGLFQLRIYQHFLFTDNPRNNLNYLSFPDINGNFIPNSTLGENPNNESDYSIVYFSLAKQFEIDNSKIYIYGKFNNYELTDDNEMIYNPSLETFEGILILKQGFYNYKYVIVKNNMILKNQISGSFFQTENSYTVLVYKKGFEDLYDNLIGVGRTNSFELKY